MQRYDMFKAAVTFVLLLVVLVAVALNSGSTLAAEQDLTPATDGTVDLPPSIGDSAVVAGCIELSGAGAASSELQIRSDETILGNVIVGEDGTWSLTTCVDPGNFRLVAVSVNAAGVELNRSAGLVVLVPAVPSPIPTEIATVEPTAGTL